MKLSIVIPTYNGKHKILKLLKSLENQIFKDFEVIILIDGSSDGTQEFLESKSFQLDLKIFFRENGGRAVARNTGAKFAKGKVLIFFDDDLRLKENTLQKHYEHHIQYPNSALTGTASLDPELCNTEISKYRYFIETERWRKTKVAKAFQMTKENLQINTNFSIAKKSFERLEGFDERLKDSEDFDLGTRLLKNDIPTFLDESIGAWHDDYVSFENYAKRQEEYVIARYKLARLRPEILKNYPQDFAMIQGMEKLKSSLKSVFAYNKFWGFLIDSLFFKKFVPQKLRYQVYDWVIYAHSRKKLLQYKKSLSSKKKDF